LGCARLDRGEVDELRRFAESSEHFDAQRLSPERRDALGVDRVDLDPA